MRNAADQTRALARAFLARFFDNELSGGSRDLTTSFAYLVGFIAPIGFLMPWSLAGTYEHLFYRGGLDLIRAHSMAHKTFYLTLGMVVAGGVTIVTWSSLLIDRRDALVLGVLPVERDVVVRAKIRAIAAYVGLVVLGMHAAGSVSFGFVLGAHNTLIFAVRGVFAHLIACSAAGAFTFLVVLAAQSVAAALLPARVLSRASPALQTAITVLTVTLFFSIAAISGAVMTFVNSGGTESRWLLAVPPVWFLGVYESLIGTRDPLLHRLAWMATVSMTALAAIVLGLYPVASRRAMTTAIEGGAETSGSRRWSRVADLGVRALAGSGAVRASLQFFTTTAIRVSTHRFIAAIGGGIIAAVVLPIALAAVQAPRALRPSIAILAAPLIGMALSLVTLRVSAAFPSEIQAAWPAIAIGSPAAPIRAGLRRALFALGVLPWVVGTAVAIGVVWDWPLALTHAVLATAAGVVLMEALLYRIVGMPCTRPWRPEHANVRLWWPLYLVVLIVLTEGMPSLTLAIAPLTLTSTAWIAGLTAALVAILRRTGRRPTPHFEDEEADVSFT